MANYVKGPLGAFSGKIGSLVGSNWRSINYMRSLPKPSKKPAIKKQKDVREAFKIAHDFLSPLRDLLNISYPIKAGSKKSAFDIAMTAMITSMEGTYPDLKIDYKNLELSKGGLSPIRGKFSFKEHNDLLLTWEPHISIGTSEAIDLIYIVLYNEKRKEFLIWKRGERGDGGVMIDKASLYNGSYHAWTFASSYDCERFSNSTYHGLIEL